MKIFRFITIGIAAVFALLAIVGFATAALSGHQEILPALGLLIFICAATITAFFWQGLSLSGGLLNCILVGLDVRAMVASAVSSDHSLGTGHPTLLWTGLSIFLICFAFNAVVLIKADPNLPLVLKQMRQRALGTWLTLLSVVLGVSLAIMILILFREADRLFGQTSYGFEVIVGKPGSATQLVMNTVYHVDTSAGNIPYSVYESMLDPDRHDTSGKPKFKSLFGTVRRPPAKPAATEPATTQAGEGGDKPFDYSRDVKVAIPIVVGDSYQGRFRIVGTTTNMFGIDDETGKTLDAEHQIPYRPEDADNDAQYYSFSDGRCFAPNRFEAVLGSEVAKKSDLRMGSEFKATHGEVMTSKPDIHPEQWKVVGVLKPTHTAADNCVYIPLLSCYTIEEHEKGLKAQWILQNGGEEPPKDADDDDVHAYKINPDGTFKLFVPKPLWEISAIEVKTRGMPDALIYKIRARHDAMAASPARTMQEFFGTFLKPSQVLLLVIAFMVSIVAAVGILVSIYNSVAARSREIAIIRALGATRNRVLLLICTEAGLIGLIGSVVGLVAAHLAAGVASIYFEKYLGQGIGWYRVAGTDWLYVAGITVLAVLAGFVPAIKAYSTPVATNLVAN